MLNCFVPSFVSVIPLAGSAAFLSNLAILGMVVVALFLLTAILRSFFRQLASDLPLVALDTSRVPLILMATAIGLKLALTNLSTLSALPWIQQGLTALIVVTVAYWLNRLLVEVVTYALHQYAERSEAMWDDVAIPILRSVLPFLIYLTAALLFLQTLGVDLTGLLVAMGGTAFILGFALKDILANFFSGLVLLIDTPFRFGDVIQLPDKTRGIIKHIGLRLTELYLIDTHSEIYIPNAAFEAQSIINLSRPTNHYYHTISIPIRADVNPSQAITMMENVVLAHPDTMGEIERKLEMIDRFYGYSTPDTKDRQKREAGRQRLLAEQEVNTKLMEIETALLQMSDRISNLEKNGLDAEERRVLKGQYLKICEMIGLESKLEQGDRQRRWLVEVKGDISKDGLIGRVRTWYQYWLKDPDLFREDQQTLKKEWERKISSLQIKVNRLFRAISTPRGLDTRLDNQVENFRNWLRENFKSSRNEWQDPKIWINEVQKDSRDTTVRFYVDDITLEHCERGQRIVSEVKRELVWHLRQAYLCN